MTDTSLPEKDRPAADCGEQPAGAAKPAARRSKSMHDGVPVWYDCCSCEAEPYWLESGAEDDR